MITLTIVGQFLPLYLVVPNNYPVGTVVYRVYLIKCSTVYINLNMNVLEIGIKVTLNILKHSF